ncbi:type II toxin-antitoxin system VapC family toxin [Pseudomonas sp. UBA4194]|uniref:type II toxin-antitoxin system VapC family toxin n=1 Tax=Pseudomonas sp. UBA4194 TaxID=1947317 RepID=UPI0025D53F93|nr:type II toxin-antitoxin system VapC family toxin [Pseudomonas sp. UBA4194]
MKLLLDTHILIWVAQDSPMLSPKARALIANLDHELYFSAASLWELAIKNSLSRTGSVIDTARLRRQLLLNGYTELPITSAHAMAVENLPPIHRDPFDRLLFAQASTESLQLLTADALLVQYGPPTVQV